MRQPSKIILYPQSHRVHEIVVDRKDGDDLNPGTREKPVRSIARAMDLGYNIIVIDHEEPSVY